MSAANADRPQVYNQTDLLDSFRDDETSRAFFIPTWRDRLEGRRHVQAHGHTVEFGDDDIALPVVYDAYYLFSVCKRIHDRMANDFYADERCRLGRCLSNAWSSG